MRGDIDGRNSCYCLDPQGVADLREAFDGLLGGLAVAAAWTTSEPEEETTT